MWFNFFYNEQLSQDVFIQKYLNGIFKIVTNFNTRRIEYYLLTKKIGYITFCCGKAQLHIRFGVKTFLHCADSKRKGKNILSKLFAKYFSKYNLQKNQSFLMFCNRTGETFLQAGYINHFLKQNKIENSIFITSWPYLKTILNLYCRDKEIITIPFLFNEFHFFNSEINLGYNGWKIYQMLPSCHFLNLERKLQAGENVYFYDEIKKRLHINATSTGTAPIIAENTKQLALQKLNLLNLRKNKFVYISSGAQSNPTMSDNFWTLLSNIIKKQFDLDVLFNIQDFSEKNEFGGISLPLSFPEAMYVATMASCVIGIRSGFMDLIAGYTENCACIYKPFYDRGYGLTAMSAEKVIKGFSLKKLPAVNFENIIELDAEKFDENEILYAIIKFLEKITVKSNMYGGGYNCRVISTSKTLFRTALQTGAAA